MVYGLSTVLRVLGPVARRTVGIYASSSSVSRGLDLLFPALRQLRALSSGGTREGMDVSQYVYSTLAVSQPLEWVAEVRLNRPDKRNAMNQTFWKCVTVCVCVISVPTNSSSLLTEKWRTAFNSSLRTVVAVLCC